MKRVLIICIGCCLHYVAGVVFGLGIEQAIAQANDFANYTETTDNLNIEMIAVQGGTFMMGCTSEQGDDCDNNEKPAHQVTVGDFYIGKYEITTGQYFAVMLKDVDIPDLSNFPMEIDWYDALEFIQQLNVQTGKQYRLPTEAEWEFAARGGNNSRGYKYSGSDTINSVAWYRDNSGGKCNPVGLKPANELGIYDMSGNVWEWCSDWYNSYDNPAQPNPQGSSSESSGGIRGGGWNNVASEVRVSYRLINIGPLFRYYSIGVRLACDSD